MKTCRYCGKVNETELGSCNECGSRLDLDQRSQRNFTRLASKLRSKLRTLNVWSATAAYGGYLLFTTLLVILFAIPGMGSDPGLVWKTDTGRLLYWTLSPLAGLLGVIAVSMTFFPSSFKDPGAEGGAWVFGGLRACLKGFSAGVLIGLLDLAICPVPDAPQSDVDSISLRSLFYTPGASQLCWVLIVVVLGPLEEETLFRGVLYGGFRRSFGAGISTALTTVLFLLMHTAQSLQSLGFLLTTTLLSLAAIWSRLAYRAIGPAVAVHSGFNLVICIDNLYNFYSAIGPGDGRPQL